MDLRTLSLCSGGGGLEIGVELAVPGSRVVCFVEWEAFCQGILVSRMEAGVLAPAPLWSDLRTFRGEKWRGEVDLVTAGFPCQPFSQAGARRGTEDPRHLWPHVHRVIEEARPPLVFLENVPGIISTLTIHHRRTLCDHFTALDAAAEAAPTPRARWYIGQHRERLYRRLLKQHGISVLLFVLCQLEELGYECTPVLVTASEVGASHKRERVFILAVADCGDEGVADTKGARCSERSKHNGGTEAGSRLSRRGHVGGLDTEVPLFPPGRGELERWAEVLAVYPELAPATESPVCGVVDGLAATRRGWLRALGNGVVPLQAAYGFSLLAAKLFGDDE